MFPILSAEHSTFARTIQFLEGQTIDKFWQRKLVTPDYIVISLLNFTQETDIEQIAK